MGVDTVIVALGQVPETGFVRELGISLGKTGTIETDPRTGATSIEGVFAGGRGDRTCFCHRCHRCGEEGGAFDRPLSEWRADGG